MKSSDTGRPKLKIKRSFHYTEQIIQEFAKTETYPE